MAQSRPWARAPSSPQHCLALTKSRHSPTSWAVQLNTAMGGLVLASWPKPSASAPVWQSPVPRSAAEGRGQGQRGTGSGRAPYMGAAPAEAGGCWREMLLGIPWGLLEPVVRVWGNHAAGSPVCTGARASSPLYRDCGEGASWAVGSRPRARRGCRGAVGAASQRWGEPCPHPWAASAGAAPSARVAALQPDGAGAGRGSAGHSAALPESPSARHLPHTQHSPPWPWGMCRLRPARRLPAAWCTRAPRPEDIFHPRLRAHGVGQR